jgi:hypothetical protein
MVQVDAAEVWRVDHLNIGGDVVSFIEVEFPVEHHIHGDCVKIVRTPDFSGRIQHAAPAHV